MDEDDIIRYLKEYQFGNERTKELYRGMFLGSVNPQVVCKAESEALDPNMAIDAICEAMDAITLYPIKTLHAMLQLCRKNDPGYTEAEDLTLLRALSEGTYFSSTNVLLVESIP